MNQGFAVFAGLASEIIRESAREAEALGYRSFWVNHPGSTDGLASLAVAARETRRIELGVGVIPLHTREPGSIIEGVSANALPRDRLLLGVGSPNPGALARVRAGIGALRAQVPARLVVAALGPKMCRLAGEVADAVLFNWLTPEHARVSGDWVRAGAEAAGRRPPRLFAYVRLAHGAAAADRLAQEGTRYAGIPAYADHFARMGVKPAETAIAVQTLDAIPEAIGRWQGVVDDLVLRAITPEDTVEEHLELVRLAKPS
jgi:alkanesulfonate monooxygenase SsuD/methylene tetrahydromethanopterin reductase-like flavin-dependent oxidoreductase (luciferase family)